MITPHDYQRDALNNIYLKFLEKVKILFCLPTAGGKTFIFSFLTQFWGKEYKQKVLILCHRIELIDQTIKSLNQIGVTCEKVTSKVKKLDHSSHAYIAMVETGFRRLKQNPFFFKEVGLVIADECHLDLYQKVFNYFPNAKILGCTATPVVQKRVKFFKCKYCKEKYELEQECCGVATDEWSKPFALAEVYEDIVLGPGIDELIRRGNLVQEITFNVTPSNIDKIVFNDEGDATDKSIDEVFSNDEAVFNCLLNYERLSKGKKTIIFNSNTKHNLMVYEQFKSAGVNVRMYDSVNKQESGNRTDLIRWFDEEDDAVLLNVGAFVAGFDCKEVQSIILNCAIGSLSGYIQRVGRGARSTTKIYKDNFLLIDGGGNVDRHQEFSDPTRDWERIFFEGIGIEKCKKQDAFDVELCDECGFMYAKSEPCCPECGFVLPPKIKKEKEQIYSDTILMPIREIPPPNGEKIYQYTKGKNEDVNFAFKIMISQIKDMFIFYRIDKDTYIETKESGELDKKIGKMIRGCYFLLVSKQDIKAANNRTIAYLKNKTIEKLDKYYDITPPLK